MLKEEIWYIEMFKLYLRLSHAPELGSLWQSRLTVFQPSTLMKIKSETWADDGPKIGILFDYLIGSSDSRNSLQTRVQFADFPWFYPTIKKYSIRKMQI